MALPSIKLEIQSFKNAVYQVWFELTHWLWRRRFLNFVDVFSLFYNYLSLENGVALQLNKNKSPSPKDAFCQVWLKLVQGFWRRRWKCEKFTTTMTTTTPSTIIGLTFIYLNFVHFILKIKSSYILSIHVIAEN